MFVRAVCWYMCSRWNNRELSQKAHGCATQHMHDLCDSTCLIPSQLHLPLHVHTPSPRPSMPTPPVSHNCTTTDNRHKAVTHHGLHTFSEQQLHIHLLPRDGLPAASATTTADAACTDNAPLPWRESRWHPVVVTMVVVVVRVWLRGTRGVRYLNREACYSIQSCLSWNVLNRRCTEEQLWTMPRGVQCSDTCVWDWGCASGRVERGHRSQGRPHTVPI